MRLFFMTLVLPVCSTGSVAVAQAFGASNLAGNTVLIVRHAEKPEVGKGLTAEGEARARAYVRYFEPFDEAGVTVKVDALYAGADSENSIRPRLTLEPLSKATGLKLDTSVGTKEPQELVKLLRTTPHGSHPLVAWRHGQIPALLTAFGASSTLIPGGKWPDEVYDWVIVLTFDRDGRLATQTLVHESLKVGSTPE